jgi:hypothetical protein
MRVLGVRGPAVFLVGREPAASRSSRVVARGWLSRGSPPRRQGVVFVSVDRPSVIVLALPRASTRVHFIVGGEP